MRIFLVDKERITNYFIQDNLDDFFVITYRTHDTKENVLITFDIRAEKKVIKSNGTVNVFSNNQIAPEVILVENGIYILKILGSKDYVYMYTYPNLESSIYRLDIKDINEIKIGNGQDCNIIHKNASTNKLHAIIRKINDRYRIENVENSYIYVNNRKVNHCYLSLGDTIFINGIKIVFMTNFITINNPRDTVSVMGINMYIDKNIPPSNSYDEVSAEEKVADLYKEEDYFYHIPRLKEIEEDELVAIEAPPSKYEEEETPFWLSIGSSLTMCASSFMMLFNIYNGFINGKSFISILPQVIMCLAMVISALILPRAAKSYKRKILKKKETKRQEKYTEYLGKKETEIKGILKKQEQILNDNNLSVENCIGIINNNGRNFWSRQIEDSDFLTIRLGNGSISPKLDIEAPEEHFSLETDNLLQNVYDMVSKYKKLDNVPIIYSLLEKRISAMIGTGENKENYIKSILLQLITLHSPQDLKIVIFTNEFNKEKWEYVRFLPHLFSEDKKVRFLATDEDEMKKISSYLEEEIKNRKEKLSTESSSESIKKDETYKIFDSYYLIIDDDYRKSKDISIINNILKSQENLGFSLLVVEDSMKYVPKECENFIQFTDKQGAILSRNISSKNQINFNCEYIEDLDIKTLFHKLCNIPVTVKEGLSVLPQSLSFLDMYGVSKIEQLNIANRWKTNNPVNSLSATVGVHASGEEFKLNLHEKDHGPHGLIAGSTGSGKSEFIITYILSMALNYHPYEVQFVLIDYKGGGLAGAFQNKETGVKIPHLIGTITNLDVSEMNRTLVSIESELKRRQKIFNKVRDSLGESTIDIYKYQRLYREGAVKEPMAHLFIISDEFAELKTQQPEFMQELIQIARIGRSLGVHLILATQKPTGVVNDQIWSNSKFKVCLKVQDRSDSMGMLKRPDAASIKEAGRFYLQVGYNDYFDIGQSGWAGAKYVPSDKIIKKIDDNLDFIDNTGNIIKSIKEVKPIVEVKNDLGDQLTNIVKYIYNLGLRENLSIQNLWLDPIPSEIYVDNIKKKYNYKPTSYFINPVIGEYDVPGEQIQNILNLNLTENGNTIIYGQPESGKENLLTTIMWSSIIEHTPDEINIYLIDCGTEALGTFANMPHVGEVATLSESEKIVGILQMVQDEIERRKELFVEYAGSYKEYIQNSGNKLPLIVTIINNYEVFVENYGKISDSIQNFYRDGYKYGIVFIISVISTNSIRSRMLQNFNNKIMLQVPNELDYRSYLGAPKGLVPAKYFGRGIVAMNKTAYEFQTAYITLKKDINTLIRTAAKQLSNAYTSRAAKVPVVPNIVTTKETKEYLNENFFPIGFDINTKLPHSYIFDNKVNLIVSGFIDQNEIDFINAIIKQLKNLNKNVVVLDFAEAYEKDYEVILYNKDFDNSFIKIYNEVVVNNKETYYVVLGAGFLKTKLPKTQQIVNKLFENIDRFDKTHFIFFDTYESMRTLQTEMWYQKIDKNSGIWLGPGVSNQSCIKISKLSMDDRNLGFEYMAFAVKNGNYNVIKFVIDREVDE